MLLRATRGQPPYPKLTRTSMFALPLVRFAGLSEWTGLSLVKETR